MRIFISYRRADSKSITLSIRLRLEREADFDVFHDIVNIPDGYDFRTYLRDGVTECDVLLVVIGDKWVSICDDTGKQRLANPDDFVRIEVKAGLERQPDCLVLPVLVNNATPLTERQLPDDLKDLAFLNMGRKVREDDDFESDMQKIIQAIRQFNPSQRPSAYKKPALNSFKPNQALQDFYDALEDENWELAEGLMGQLSRYKQNNPNKLRGFDVEGARQAIEEAQHVQARAEEYELLRVIAKKNPSRLAKALDDFKRVYPDYDPEGLQALCAELARKAPPPTTSRQTPPAPAVSETPASGTPLQNALVRARAFTGTRNADWTPYITTLGELDPSTPLPDMPMCLVPVGKFMMGSDGGEIDEKPVHEQVIREPYWIARYPVTNAQWRVAVEAKVVTAPSDKRWYDDKSMAHSPVVYVNWYECLKFAQWAKCSLPTEPVWEYAARGVENLVYPWGNAFEAERVIYRETPEYGGKKPAPIDSRPQGASWVGAEQLSGNVWEWQLSAYEAYPYVAGDGREDVNRTNVLRVLRGGSWYFDFNRARAVFRYSNLPVNRLSDLGFRVVLSLKSPSGL